MHKHCVRSLVSSLFVLLAFSFVNAPVQADDSSPDLQAFYNWHAKSGTVCRAQYIDMEKNEDGNWFVKLRLESGKEIDVSCSQLTPESVALLKNLFLASREAQSPDVADNDEGNKLLQLSKLAYLAGDEKGGTATLLRASRLNPKDLRANFYLGMLYSLIIMNPEKAEKHFNQCVMTNKTHTASLNNRAVVTIRMGNWSRVVRVWEELLEVAADEPIVRYNFLRFRNLVATGTLVIPKEARIELQELLDNYDLGDDDIDWRYDDFGWKLMLGEYADHSDSDVVSFIRSVAWAKSRNDIQRALYVVVWSMLANEEYCCEFACMKCSGRGMVDCPHCTGGTRVAARDQTSTMSVGSGYHGRLSSSITTRKYESEYCRICNGRGRLPCDACERGMDKRLLGLLKRLRNEEYNHYMDTRIAMIAARANSSTARSYSIMLQNRYESSMLYSPERQLGILVLTQLLNARQQGILNTRTAREILFSPPEAGNVKFDAAKNASTSTVFSSTWSKTLALLEEGFVRQADEKAPKVLSEMTMYELSGELEKWYSQFDPEMDGEVLAAIHERAFQYISELQGIELLGPYSRQRAVLLVIIPLYKSFIEAKQKGKTSMYNDDEQEMTIDKWMEESEKDYKYALLAPPPRYLDNPTNLTVEPNSTMGGFVHPNQPGYRPGVTVTTRVNPTSGGTQYQPTNPRYSSSNNHQYTLNTEDFTVNASNVVPGLQAFKNGAKAFSNRDYVWQNIPSACDDWRFLQVLGGEPSVIKVTARQDTTIYAATIYGDELYWSKVNHQAVEMFGWKPIETATFSYTDLYNSTMKIFRRKMQRGETVTLPQGNFAGSILLVP